jgi:hypothetical protein
MSYETQGFSEQSIQTLSDTINDFLTANPSFTAINVTICVEGAGFYSLLLYSF